MRTADLYVRISTDEQADKGYSIRSQEEVLRKYCGIQNITVRNVIYEDFSAKTFERPAWSDMLSKYKKLKRAAVDLLLFTKWDRFSRNAGDAYQMINILRKMGIDPQAVEQPLDLSIPENKMMLAFYLAAPEVENDRRALNTFYGMRRAGKEGRYLTTGSYAVNRTTEEGKKTIVPFEPKAVNIRWAFEQMAAGVLHIDSVRQELNKRGLMCSKSNFYTLLRNPTYCGKIVVPEYRDEARHLVQGQHEPIISELLFYRVQDILDGKKWVQFVKSTTEDHLPLHGFLLCPKCGRVMTGSGSKGRHSYYYYYHCLSLCGTRLKALETNTSFIKELKGFVPKTGVAPLFKMVVRDIFNRDHSSEKNAKKELLSLIQIQNDRLGKARNLLLDEAIDQADYKTIKLECETKLNSLEAKLPAFNALAINIDDCAEKVIHWLSTVDVVYQEAETPEKRSIIGSIYPEKLYFDGYAYRTARVEEGAYLMLLINNEIGSKKNRTSLDFSSLSDSVAGARLEPHCLQLFNAANSFNCSTMRFELRPIRESRVIPKVLYFSGSCMRKVGGRLWIDQKLDV